MRYETVAERLFFSTVHVTATRADGRNETATAFLYVVPISSSASKVFLISNRHVFDGPKTLLFRFLAGRNRSPVLGSSRTVTVDRMLDAPRFASHADPHVDVAAYDFSSTYKQLFDAEAGIFALHVPSLLALNESDDAVLNAIEDVAFIGYPAGLYDSKNFLPVIRRGTTASPLAVDYEGLPSFIIDASVFPGSSGSPVFIMDRGGWYQNRAGQSVSGTRTIFLGVLAAVHTFQISGVVSQLPTSRLFATIDEPIDLGIVFKAAAVDDVVNTLLLRFDHSRFEMTTSMAESKSHTDAQEAAVDGPLELS